MSIELLKAAADAIGLQYEWHHGCGDALRLTAPDAQQIYWNPLTDDGDALRLACTLRINIEHAETLSRKTHGVHCWPVGRGDCGHMENELTDYNAATRRAIVCAAAAMAATVAVG